jgi:farnesyl diphosphate synthase
MLKPQFALNTCSFDVWMHTAQEQAELCLSHTLPCASTAPSFLHEAMRYAVLDGGKRIRPLLALAAGQLCGAPPASALLVGCAVELIHAYSLVHDDMPCMDDDSLRRGKPTVHVAYGQACAMLVGDALQAAAFEVLTQPLAGVEPHVALRMVRVLAKSAGAAGMVGGQQMDVLAASVNAASPLDLPALQLLHSKKTGALLSASVTLGALAGYRYDLDITLAAALNRYSAAIGLGFQIADDVLDATADAATLGKTPGKDAAQGKSTYVSVLGLDAAKHAAKTCLADALSAIEAYGDEALRLRELAQLIVARSF